MANQAKPLPEESKLISPSQSEALGLKDPPTPPLPANQSAPLRKPAAAITNNVRIQLNTPSFPASRPRGERGACTPRCRGQEAPPTEACGYHPAQDHPPARRGRRTCRGARPCLHRLPPQRWPTAPSSRGTLVTRLPAAGPAECRRHATPLTAPPLWPANWTVGLGD